MSAYGIGGPELLIIFGVVVLLFGPSLIAFVAGYALGSRRAGHAGREPSSPEDSAHALGAVGLETGEPAETANDAKSSEGMTEADE